jgi:signal transduction histidine kinase
VLKKYKFAINDDCDDSYRQFNLKTDLKLGKTGILLITIPLVAFVLNDYYFVNLSAQFFGLVILRSALLIFVFLSLIRIDKIKNFQEYDRAITITVLILLFGCGLINATRPQNFVAQVVMTIITILVIYLVIPNRFSFQILLSSVAVAGETLIIIVFLQPSSAPTQFTLFLSLAFADFIGVLIAWHLQKYRKKSYRDLIEFKELQNKLENHSRELEIIVEDRTKKLKNKERLATIGATAGMVGHDIRNPLQAITSDLFLINSELISMPESRSKQEVKESLEDIQNNVEYINKIVQDLQDYTRPLVPTCESIDLERLCLELMVKATVPQGIIASCVIQQNAKKIMADPALLKRILSNLISNAVQAMPKGGKLDIFAYQEAGNIIITVRDTGQVFQKKLSQCCLHHCSQQNLRVKVLACLWLSV